jgi:hypothetical protein
VKRRIVFILIFLVAGALVNVAVAWGCAAWSLAKRDYSNDWWSALQEQERADPTPKYVVVHDREVGFGIERTLYRREPTGFVSGVVLPFLVRIDCGWPCRALTGEIEDTRPGRTQPPNEWSQSRNALVIGTNARSAAWRHPRGLMVLPLAPLWPGFVVNTAFYGAILWLLIPGPFALRRFVRVKRGLCPKCAYPMGESDVCTECGKGLPGRAGATW